jgi:hypothetical protein
MWHGVLRWRASNDRTPGVHRECPQAMGRDGLFLLGFLTIAREVVLHSWAGQGGFVIVCRTLCRGALVSALEAEQLLEAIHETAPFAATIQRFERVQTLRDRRHGTDAELSRAARHRIFTTAPYQDCARGRIDGDIETVLGTVVDEDIEIE